jgi:hypothetical protein
MTLLPLALAVTFRFDPAMEKIAVWGRGAELPRVYFEEWLPALFERTLVFERFEPGEAALEWIFTGERAGRMGGKPFQFLERADPYHENTEERRREEVLVEPGSLVTLSTVEVRKP